MQAIPHTVSVSHNAPCHVDLIRRARANNYFRVKLISESFWFRNSNTQTAECIRRFIFCALLCIGKVGVRTVRLAKAIKQICRLHMDLRRTVEKKELVAARNPTYLCLKFAYAIYVFFCFSTPSTFDVLGLYPLFNSFDELFTIV